MTDLGLTLFDPQVEAGEDGLWAEMSIFSVSFETQSGRDRCGA